MGWKVAIPLCAVTALMGAAGWPALADEGYWTFDHFPAAKLSKVYGTTVDRSWLDHIQAAAVRLTGCSASIVSKDGLVLTNAHCVVDCAQQLSDARNDYAKDGFTTEARTDERKCAGMQGEVLETITDVTSTIDAATKGASGLDYVRARNAATVAAESSACGKDPRLHCQVVSLYRGGQYKLYRYRLYTDLRLVFMPESDAAFFGGDPDNFNFPRFNLDIGFLRLYENGQLVSTPQHLVWRSRPPRENEVVFVAGNPGNSDRGQTSAQLETQRDLVLPIAQLQRSELRGRLISYGERGGEAKRMADTPLFDLENYYKLAFGQQFALNDPAIIRARRAEETDLKAKVTANPALTAEIGDPWGEIARAQTAYADHYLRYRQLEGYAGSGSDLYRTARTLVRGALERARPESERLPEFGDARLAVTEKQLLDPAPIMAPLEQMELEFWLSKTRELLTVDDPAVKLLLGRESPEDLAQRLVRDTALGDPAVRKALWDGGLPAVEASSDPLIQFVLRTDPAARVIRRTWEAEVSGPTDRAAERLARARFAIYGDAVYPDATFTLRLSYGRVLGWTWRGRTVTPFTTFAGFYDRATGSDPFKLPPSWTAAKDRLDLATVFNFTDDTDAIGGNSGSPMVDARGELIGVHFDGNIHSVAGDYGFNPALARSIAVSTAGATEALLKVYGRKALVEELQGR
jgi:hypothetical protein